MSVPGKRTKTELKEIAQEIIMDGIAKTLGYADPADSGYPMGVPNWRPSARS